MAPNAKHPKDVSLTSFANQTGERRPSPVSPIDPKHLKHYIPSCTSKLTMKKKIAHWFPTTLTHTTPIDYRKTPLNKIINRENLTIIAQQMDKPLFLPGPKNIIEQSLWVNKPEEYLPVFLSSPKCNHNSIKIFCHSNKTLQ